MPVVASAAAGPASLVGRHGTVLGVFEDIDVHVERRQLAVGDVVVLYTDGITDLPPPYGQTEDDVVELVAGIADRARPMPSPTRSTSRSSIGCRARSAPTTSHWWCSGSPVLRRPDPDRSIGMIVGSLRSAPERPQQM